jgi:thiol:disulfide interchange protein DsbA
MTHSKTFYTEDALNLLAKGHRPFFDAIHQEHLNLETEESIQQFFTDKLGVMPDIFNSTFNGFSVDARSRRAEELAKQYGVASTPTLVVDGRWQINASMTQGFPEMLKVMDYLIDKARSEHKKK